MEQASFSVAQARACGTRAAGLSLVYLVSGVKSMPFTPKFIAPRLAQKLPLLPALEQALAGGITVFTAPDGYLPTDNFAALHASSHPIIWVRLGPEDRDPAMLLVSLISAMQRLRAGLGENVLEQMRRQPGPVAGWPPLFTSLAQELAEVLRPRGVIVLEGCHYLGDVSSTLKLLSAYVLSMLPSRVTCILTAERSVPFAVLPNAVASRCAGDLRLNACAAQAFVNELDGELPEASVRQAVALTEGRAEALAALCETSRALGPAVVQQAMNRAAHLDDVLVHIARAWLVPTSADEQQALALALHIGYTHPELLEAVHHQVSLPAGPWLEPLEGDWTRVRRLWHAPLRAALRGRGVPKPQALQRAANYLVSQGAIEQGVTLYFEVGDRANAARAIASSAEALMALGQWETLDEWLSQLPAQTLKDWPWLVYIGGELAAAQGRLDAAQRAFALSSKLFTNEHDAYGSCQSLLAESTLAVWRGNHAQAESRALAASTVAETAGMAWHQSWAAWQLGCLAAAADNLDAALTYFDRAADAASAIDDPQVLALPRQAEQLTLHQRELRQQRELYRQAYFTVEQAEQLAVDQLHRLLLAPPVGVDTLLEEHGWTRLPLMLKLPAPEPAFNMLEVSGKGNIWNRLLGMMGMRRQLKTTHAPSPLNAASYASNPSQFHVPEFAESLGVSSLVYSLATNVVAAGSSAITSWTFEDSDTMRQTVESTVYVTTPGLEGQTSAAEPDEPAPDKVISKPTLTAYLLGTFRVTLNDCPVESWPSGRGRSIFKYLLTHRERPVPRDVLMDLFWPDASPESARNNLNVALHGLRQAFRSLDEIQVVIFEDGAYRLNYDLCVWLDVDEFERRFQTGRRLEASGQLASAAAEYEIVIGLYQDDFLVDDPYEEWPVLTRERLRVTYLEALDRLSQMYYSQGQYAACANLCQLILARDNCREDAHCRLMRCYSRQGQQPLALRQYQMCVEALRSELDVEPSPTTIELCERIRRHEPV